MSRIQRQKRYKKNWRESKNLDDRDRRIKLPKSKNRREEFEEYLEEFGGYSDNKTENINEE
jgi:ADP-heptose:LPS heptosyltransferase